MPYRDVVSVSKLYKYLKKKRLVKTIPGYREHITDKVGVMLQLEMTDIGDGGSATKSEERGGEDVGSRKEAEIEASAAPEG
eukprot:CAMPEP_0113533158 /NCGR_PEP_ID=MMETSP0015_2-20120614/4448_1 /TAXON_ID=2838 /ORGANISM="Odontella" /LENGTH=80 /DNA_ID=CAMNT_0000432177 /DNA_START=379 /DNA_END=621 /DNA_ORIENTATION=- /assembly_acc=CAM_ASM_000160